MKGKHEILNDDLQKIITEIDKNKDLKKIIEQVFEKSENIDALRTVLVLSISKYIQEKEINDNSKEENPEKNKKSSKKLIAKTIEKDQDVEKFVDSVFEVHGIGKGKYLDMNRIRARKDYKRIIAHFTIYLIYQFMNPRQIAGESKQLNYAHNLIMGGEKRAKKYAGGKDADLKKYGEKQVTQIQKQAKKIRSVGMGFGG